MIFFATNISVIFSICCIIQCRTIKHRHRSACRNNKRKSNWISMKRHKCDVFYVQYVVPVLPIDAHQTTYFTIFIAIECMLHFEITISCIQLHQTLACTGQDECVSATQPCYQIKLPLLHIWLPVACDSFSFLHSGYFYITVEIDVVDKSRHSNLSAAWTLTDHLVTFYDLQFVFRRNNVRNRRK